MLLIRMCTAEEHGGEHVAEECLSQIWGPFAVSKISKILQIFGGLVLGCIKTKFCKKICV